MKNKYMIAHLLTQPVISTLFVIAKSVENKAKTVKCANLLGLRQILEICRTFCRNKAKQKPILREARWAEMLDFIGFVEPDRIWNGLVLSPRVSLSGTTTHP